MPGAPNVMANFDTSEANAADETTCATADVDMTEHAQCRLCWGDAVEGQLVAPCNCRGSLQFIHIGCLEQWQHTLRMQGLFQKAKMCEICKTPYKDISSQLVQPKGVRRVLALLRRCNTTALELLSCPTWGIMLYRSWRAYVFFSALSSALRAGVAGLRGGVQMGSLLCKEQGTVIVRLLSTLADALGTPYAEVLFGQAVPAVALALTCEFTYFCVVGFLGGGIYGFLIGYCGAMQTTARLMRIGSVRAAGFASVVVLKALKVARIVSALVGRRPRRQLVA